MWLCLLISLFKLEANNPSWWSYESSEILVKESTREKTPRKLGHGICMQVRISYRCMESYQDEGFAGNPYEIDFVKMYQCLHSLLAGWDAEAPFGRDKAEADSMPLAVLSRLAQLIVTGETRALTCLVLSLISDLMHSAKVVASYAQGNPLNSFRYRQPHRGAGCSARKPGVWKRCLYVTHVRQRQLGIYVSNWHFPI